MGVSGRCQLTITDATQSFVHGRAHLGLLQGGLNVPAGQHAKRVWGQLSGERRRIISSMHIRGALTRDARVSRRSTGPPGPAGLGVVAAS